MRASESGVPVPSPEQTQREKQFRLALLQAALADIRASQRSNWDWQLRYTAEAFVGRRSGNSEHLHDHA